MQPKPVKRSKYIIKLSRDHHASLLFCWKLRQGRKLRITTDRMKPYVAYFAADHMAPHFAEEEDILFPPASSDPLVQQAMQQHKEIFGLVEQIAAEAGEKLPGLLDQIVDMVDKHVRFEERVLFPHLEKIIPEPTLQKISEKLDHEPEKDTWQDAFWVKPKNS